MMDSHEVYVDASQLLYKLSTGQVKRVTLQKGLQRIAITKDAGGLYAITYIGTERQGFFSYEGAIGHVSGLLRRGAEVLDDTP